MKNHFPPICWGRIFRRGLALFLATLAVWGLLTLGGGGSAADAFHSLGSDAGFVSALLQSQLGYVSAGSDPLSALSPWSRLVLNQSPLLRAGAAAARPPAAESAPPASPTPSPGLFGVSPGGPSPSPEDSDPDDPAQLPQVPAEAENIIARTILPTSSDGYDYADGVYILNRTDRVLDPAALASRPLELTVGDSAQPQVLILHTHTTEAYTPDGTDLYLPTDNSRTLDESCNMVHIGEEMKAVFEEMGLTVLHDTTVYDYPQYSGAYTRSKESVADYLSRYPSLCLILDVHRDALIGDDGTIYKPLTTIDGKPTAQISLVMGGGTEETHPNYLENLTLAFRLQKSMNLLYPTLARPIALRTSVYNQDLSPGFLLVEVGSHGNTLQEAIAGGRLFARAAGQFLLSQTIQ